MRRVVVVGAGPAGLAAAAAATRQGARVTLLDAADQVGGQYWRHLPAGVRASREDRLHHGWRTFQRLRGMLHDVELLTGSQVWALESGPVGPRLHVLTGSPDGTGRTGRTLEPDALVLATGAHDRTLPFPGWDLPGVVTGGAAQALAKGERIAIGERVVVGGTGPFLLPVATSLLQTGARVLGVYEASRPVRLARGWLARPWGLAASPGKVGELAGYLGRLTRDRVPYRFGWAVVAAHGSERVEEVTVARVDARWRVVPGTRRRLAADAVCVTHGFVPRLELPLAAGCRLTADRFVAVDDRQATSVPAVYAAGEITGIGGAAAALTEGEVAGRCAAGGEPGRAARRRRQQNGFAERLAAAHPIGVDWPAWLAPDTLVCRCEEVPYARLQSASAETRAVGLRSLRLTTRAGLGSCQGRMCGRTVEDLLHRLAPGLSEVGGTDRRPVVVPIRLAELAAADPLPPPDPREPESRPSQP